MPGPFRCPDPMQPCHVRSLTHTHSLSLESTDRISSRMHVLRGSNEASLRQVHRLRCGYVSGASDTHHPRRHALRPSRWTFAASAGTHTHTHTPSNAVYRLQGERQPVASIGMDRSIHSTRWRLIEGPLDRVRFFADSWSAAFN